MRTIEWKNGTVILIDQTKLPNETVWVKILDYMSMASAIKEMKLRGAPLIGVAAAFGLALTVFHSKSKKRADLLKELEKAAEVLRQTRPTAVNLFWAIDRIMKKAYETSGIMEDLVKAVVDEAKIMADEDDETNRKICPLHGRWVYFS